MADKKLSDVPENLNEEYYQISGDILDSFSKYRPPLDIFLFREDIARIETFFRAGDRLSNERVEELSRLVHEGFIFVSRKDHHIYVKHIAHQLDLILVDKNLQEGEIADIFAQALTMRMENFLEQPVKAAYDRLYEDIMVLTEYLWHDIYRIRALMRRLHAEHTLAAHSVNCGIMGLALYLRLNAEELKKQQVKRKVFDNLAVGLFVHDLGMSKIPLFLRTKTQALSRDEQAKILAHTTTGIEMLGKLDLRFKEVEACVGEHHERMDGSGYPQKQKGNDISPLGRLCAAVDSYCAMIVKRPFAPAMSPADACAALVKDEKRYDPRMTRALQAIVLTGK
ncbi:putative metal dependent phosphohydrolase [Desulfovibrio sp. X2]|uniref:HD-GYP domain-containing protein n=1 Tax=Desulfovibrio sp. X2 TaxID=941449 RepID=UPI0003589883|nr:HD domain-containing phosphohydrolase [Desulfovibrio sp. X2]EPR44458.1 putative metal dependent phosphohydrolase [Desulfovibrio sp. X2]